MPNILEYERLYVVNNSTVSPIIYWDDYIKALKSVTYKNLLSFPQFIYLEDLFPSIINDINT